MKLRGRQVRKLARDLSRADKVDVTYVDSNLDEHETTIATLCDDYCTEHDVHIELALVHRPSVHSKKIILLDSVRKITLRGGRRSPPYKACVWETSRKDGLDGKTRRITS